MNKRLRMAAKQRQRRSIFMMEREITAVLLEKGVNLPPVVKSVKSTQPSILGEVIKRGAN